MNIYKKMYLNLFNQATDAINLLQKAQQDTEDYFINNEDSIEISDQALALIKEKAEGKDLSAFVNEIIIKALS